MSQAGTEKHRRKFAVILFSIAFVFVAAEVIMVCTAKRQHDYDTAKTDAEELSVELGIISSSFRSGDKALYDDTLVRYRITLMEFGNNDYIRQRRAELLEELREYDKLLGSSEADVVQLLELRAAVASVSDGLYEIIDKPLDAVNFYRIQESFHSLQSALDNIQNEDFKQSAGRIKSFAGKVSDLAKSSAVCVSICSPDSFKEKRMRLAEIKQHYEEEFRTLGSDATEKYDPSKLIQQLSEL